MTLSTLITLIVLFKEVKNTVLWLVVLSIKALSSLLLFLLGIWASVLQKMIDWRGCFWKAKKQERRRKVIKAALLFPLALAKRIRKERKQCKIFFPPYHVDTQKNLWKMLTQICQMQSITMDKPFNTYGKLIFIEGNL